MRIIQPTGRAALLLLCALLFTQASLADTSVEALSKRCDALASVDFSRIPDALTQVTEAKSIAASAQAPAVCVVSGYVAPSVGFVLRLPANNWNGKLIEVGCGGWCGSTDPDYPSCVDPLRRGYACISSDGGHKGGDAKWAYNNIQAKIDLAYGASHVTALAGKTIAEHYYSRTPSKSYFMGCSRGGVQALEEAQKFPWDFDGIIAGAPGPRITQQWMDRLWNRRAMTNEDGSAILGRSDLELLHRAVLAKCDLNDGIKDGLIGDPRACRFDPSELRCTAGSTGTCLTEKQIEAAKKIYSPLTARAQQIAFPAALAGSESNWLDWFWGALSGETFLGEGFRYAYFWPDPGPTWRLPDFDFDRDYKRLGMTAGLWEPSPDLRAFKAAGGKLLAYMGWSDVAAGGPLATVDYYETAERIVGGRTAAQDFFRLFMIPGMNHCTGGDGAFAIDYLSYLEEWVERGKPPDKLIGSHIPLPADLKQAFEKVSTLSFPLSRADIEFSRPVYPYPTVARYRGRGDPKDAASFVPAQP